MQSRDLNCKPRSAVGGDTDPADSALHDRATRDLKYGSMPWDDKHPEGPGFLASGSPDNISWKCFPVHEVLTGRSMGFIYQIFRDMTAVWSTCIYDLCSCMQRFCRTEDATLIVHSPSVLRVWNESRWWIVMLLEVRSSRQSSGLHAQMWPMHALCHLTAFRVLRRSSPCLPAKLTFHGIERWYVLAWGKR